MSGKGSLNYKQLKKIHKPAKQRKYSLTMRPKQRNLPEPPEDPNIPTLLDPSEFLPVQAGNRVKVLYRYTSGNVWVERWSKGSLKRVLPFQVFVHYDSGEKSWVSRTDPNMVLI